MVLGTTKNHERTTFHCFSLLYEEPLVGTFWSTLFSLIAHIFTLFENWTTSFCFLTQYMYGLEDFLSNKKVRYWNIRKKLMYKKATLKIFGWDIPTISWFLPIFGHFWLVQNDKWHQKFIFYIWGNFFKVLLSTLLLESMDYRSVGLKCLTQRFAVFPFS